MNQNKSSYLLLIEKLDQFIRKYYINKLIRGALYSVGAIVLCFLLFALAEHFFYFDTTVRKILLFGFLAIAGVSLGRWVLSPLIHYFRLGEIISHEQAAEIIGNHFTDVKDKLINILQLKKQADTQASRDLILASIEQKTQQIRPIPFQSAIDLSDNRKYLRYALPPLLLLLGLLIAAPSLIKDPTNRIIRNNQVFEKAAPFSFHISNPSLDVPQYEDFALNVMVEGDYVPDDAFIVINGFQYRLKKISAGSFGYVFNNVQKDQEFNFSADGVESKPYNLHVLKKPNILDFQTTLDYPAYIGRPDESLNNIGDLVVPQGTQIDWLVNAVNTDEMAFVMANEANSPAKRLGEGLFTFGARVFRNSDYRIVVGNDLLPKSDSVGYSISVVPDLYPSISVKPFLDSTESRLVYLVGDASDDYGLRRLTFNYQVFNSGAPKGDPFVEDMNEPDGKRINFDRVFDLNGLDLAPGDEVHYYFEVFDNDGVNGSKSSKSAMLTFAKPTVEEFEKQEDANEEDIKRSLEKAKTESEKIKKDFQSLREKMLQEKSLDWQMKKELEDLLDRQKSLEEELEDAKQKYDENLENQEEFDQLEEDEMEKQEKMQELFEELLDDETQELMDKIRELMEELNKDDALQMMEEMEMNDEELNMELERLMELFKQLELERDLGQQLEKLEELGKKEEALSEETKQSEEQENESDSNEENSNQELEKKQEDINKAFEDIKKEMEELMKRNEELGTPKNIESPQQEMQDIQQKLNESLEQLQENQNNKASESQKDAGQKMQDLAQQMQQQMEQSDMQQMAEDMKAMRQLLENLVGLSFDQEDLIEEINKTNTSTPRYIELVQQQNKLKDDFLLIEDSLKALSQRVFQIESFVLEKVTDVNSHMSKSLRQLEDRKKAQATEHQQRTMKNVNDLALMFSESMNQMQQQMASMMSGQQMCTKPGSNSNPKDGAGVPMDKISEGQKNLNGEIKEMKDGMKEGIREGSSEEFAKMAAKQAALRKALREIQNAKQQLGQGSKELEEILQEMDNIETQLVNKRLTNEMLKRQQEILTRLLESERAEREREFENKRESETGVVEDRPLPPSIEKYIKERESQIEPFKTISPSLKPYYKQLVEEYYKSLKAN
ncbi:MAG: DUF4175 domain-containing protein [Saprospiraceae bacterium]|nr:DUF4175 domain-containing protein [Saprospiraceae bacterium]